MILCAAYLRPKFEGVLGLDGSEKAMGVTLSFLVSGILTLSYQDVRPHPWALWGLFLGGGICLGVGALSDQFLYPYHQLPQFEPEGWLPLHRDLRAWIEPGVVLWFWGWLSLGHSLRHQKKLQAWLPRAPWREFWIQLAVIPLVWVSLGGIDLGASWILGEPANLPLPPVLALGAPSLAWASGGLMPFVPEALAWIRDHG